MRKYVKSTLTFLKGMGNMFIFPVLMMIVGTIIVLSVAWNSLIISINIGTALFTKPAVRINEIEYTINNHQVVRPQIGEVFAKLRINSIGMEKDIIHGQGDDELRRGIGHSTGSTLPGEGGNVILCAHRDTAFSSLQDVKNDDEVDIETSYGTYEYKVSDIKIIKDLNDVSPLNTTDHEELTMYTCYPFSYIGSAPFRIIFKCSFIKCV